MEFFYPFFSGMALDALEYTLLDAQHLSEIVSY